jgi:hypothetical protein
MTLALTLVLCLVFKDMIYCIEFILIVYMFTIHF